jgi:hypothetical protein
MGTLTEANSALMRRDKKLIMAKDENRKPGDDSESKADPMSEAEIDRNLVGSFPASDPPSWTLGTDHETEESVQSSDEVERNKTVEDS